MISARKIVWLQAYLFVLAVLLNFIWEVAQISAYDFPDSRIVTNVLGCFVPTLGDGLMILIIYWTGWLVFREFQWILSPGARGYLLMMVIGLILAVFVEWNALYWTGVWAYNEQMIMIPILGVGLLPILQMIVLPPATALLLQRIWRDRKEGT